MNTKYLVKVNIINLELLILVFLITKILSGNNLVILIYILFFGYVCFSNYLAIFKVETSVEDKLLKASKNSRLFRDMAKHTIKSIEGIREREELLSSSEDYKEIAQACNIAIKQFYVNVDYIIKYMETFDSVTCSQIELGRIRDLVNENDILLGKLNEIIKQSIEIDKSVDNIDTSVLDDLINSLKEVTNNGK